MILIDAHCHFETPDPALLSAALDRARQAGLVHAVVVGLMQKPGDFGHALEAARQNPDFLSPTMGIHPHDSAKATPADLAELDRLCALPEVVAVGETGLDYFYNHSDQPAQRTVFRHQCQLAKRVGKPIVIHVRDAHDECYEILRGEGMERGMIHCFTGNAEQAARYLALGFHISISGIVTYKKTDALQEAVRQIPLNRLMLETDAPFLAPVPHRGKPNEPAWVRETANKVAQLKGIPPEEIALQAARNTVELLRLKVRLPEN